MTNLEWEKFAHEVLTTLSKVRKPTISTEDLKSIGVPDWQVRTLMNYIEQLCFFSSYPSITGHRIHKVTGEKVFYLQYD